MNIISVQLQLSACLPHQFTCHNGKCVSMNSRCDNVEVRTLHPFQVFVPSQDCDDSSDEKKCRMVSFDEEKYLKNKPPPPLRGLEKLTVTARYIDLYEYNFIFASVWRSWLFKRSRRSSKFFS